MHGSSPMRIRHGARLLAASGSRAEAVVLDAGEGVRLQGVYNAPREVEPRGLALLLHGWEGSTESSYMRLTAAKLLDAGWATFRLNFRDHGGSHHLNRGLFHSNRIDEVVRAAMEISRRYPSRPLVAAGYSLGGNFALRLALRAPDAGLPLARVAAVCPLVDPAATMDAMERGMPQYQRYFEHKWRRSLLRKRELFPEEHDFDDSTLRLRMRDLTAWMVERHTDFADLDAYFDGYSIAGDRLAALQVPADILMAADDPVIPLRHFRELRPGGEVRLELARHGGHCGFLENRRFDGYGESWVARQLAA
jgi:predicted alpha/beta-fold hydrolase